MSFSFNQVLATVAAALVVLFVITMFINAITNKKLRDSTKSAWSLCIVVLPLIGAFFYYAYQYEGKFSIKKYVAY